MKRGHRRVRPVPASWVLILLVAGTLPSQEQGKILRPAHNAALPSGEVDVVATAPGAWLELDGQRISAQEPFRDVFHAIVSVAEGEHRLALVWGGGRQEIRFFAGSNPPEGFKTFVAHPPVQTQCTDCHGVSRRGRFRFEGGCFGCHQESAFTSSHPHPVHILEQCGMCHNAHGSTEKAHLIHPREVACKQCHN
jgi:predicted CXXCH cytochrome family protein